ncbi:radical SAM protein with 4Fe4S-binding SPASM domain [Neobacillus niacini]|nr:SPASM domain-containing protein [Neobacillus niacini]MDQ0999749.1 radical SAM protein with 4Fe4S-binding SPASM domain [Neobacillus niacini]
MGLPATVCIFSETCGRAAIIEHNGDVYSCDHFMYLDYKLGNIQD